uniref:Ribosomal protein S20 n=1 Tax=Spumella sp. Baekdong012001B8 TaxID=2782410 RepID=A0A7S6PV93_9STRA|nr:ribosomal protein S20 [Spumella sp. Baekdong012001B8]
MIKKTQKKIKQNKRNRIANRHYRSTAQNLLKALKAKIKELKTTGLCFNEKAQADLLYLQSKIYSAFDKATQRGAMHKNAAKRKRLQSQLAQNAFMSLR